MKIIGFIIAASLALTVLQAAFAVLVVGLLLTIAFCAIFKPWETMAWTGVMITCWLVSAHPLASLAALVAMFIAGSALKRT